MRIGSLCTGAGMLDIAARQLFGGEHAWVAENDLAAAYVLVSRFGVRNLGDITTVDWRRVETVDILTAGYPCQDLSNAGKRAGIEGAKSGVWRHVADAVGVLRPRLVLLENVRGHLARGFGRVLGDLAALGYDTDWTCLRASDVGAPHQRDRVFIAAYPAAHPDRIRVRLEHEPVGARVGQALAGGDREDALMPTPTAGLGRGSGMPAPGLAASRMADGRRFLDDAVALLPTPCAGDSKNTRNATAGRTTAKDSTHHDGWTLSDVAHADRWGHYGSAISRWEAVLGRSAPDPTTTGKRGGRRLSAQFVEWMMGWPSRIGRAAAGGATQSGGRMSGAQTVVAQRNQARSERMFGRLEAPGGSAFASAPHTGLDPFLSNQEASP